MRGLTILLLCSPSVAGFRPLGGSLLPARGRVIVARAARRAARVQLAVVSPSAAEQMTSSALLRTWSDPEATSQWTEQDWERVYRSAGERGVLAGFGCVSGLVPTDVTVAELEQRTGLTLEALTPRGSGSKLALLGAGFFFIELLLAKTFGAESSLIAALPTAAFAFVIDQLFLGSRLTLGIILFLQPEYGAKLARHEAGHFLLAYLCGLPVTGYFLAGAASPAGQAGTIFLDVDLFEQINKGKLRQSALARYATILMGGIAAEAICFDRAEGGYADEQALVAMLSNLSPPWKGDRILALARWSVVSAVELLREYKEEHDALAAKMAANAPLGECIAVISRGIEARQRRAAPP